MTPLFISHLGVQDRISLAYASSSLLYVFAIVLALVAVTATRRQMIALASKESFGFQTTETLKGIAILFLVFGHLSRKCVEGGFPFPDGGTWAVTIFVFLSGIGLTKIYGLERIGTEFWIKRAKRLILPVWITLLSFYLLDFCLLGRTHSPTKIALTFLGIIRPLPPNSPAWFVTYIMFLYVIFWAVSSLNLNKFYKFFIILLALQTTTCGVVALGLGEYFGNWVSYTIVFPLGILSGLEADRIQRFMRSAYTFSRWGYFFALLMLLWPYFRGPTGVSALSHLFSLETSAQVIDLTRPLYLIVGIAMWACWLDGLHIHSRFLSFLGKYSLEIFLVHLPFMEYYDFFLFRKPLAFYFFLYLSFICLMSYQLKILCDFLNGHALSVLGSHEHAESC